MPIHKEYVAFRLIYIAPVHIPGSGIAKNMKCDIITKIASGKDERDEDP